MEPNVNSFLKRVDEMPDPNHQIEMLIRKAFHYGFMQALSDDNHAYEEYGSALETLVFRGYHIGKDK